MFTGIVKEIGVLERSDKIGNAYKLAIRSKEISDSVSMGDSVLVNGVCLTLVKNRNGVLSFDVMEETMRRSTLAALKNGESVNLEGSLRSNDPLGGHFVLGHIDCIGKIKDVNKKSDEYWMEIEFPEEFTSLVVEKGSIAIDGVSLTVGEVRKDRFKVYLIPHTLKITDLGLKRIGDELNIEFDIIGKYIYNIQEIRDKKQKTGYKGRVTDKFLKEKGF